MPIADGAGRSAPRGVDAQVVANVVQQSNLDQPPRLGLYLYPSRDDWHHARQAAGMKSDPHEHMHAGGLEMGCPSSCSRVAPTTFATGGSTTTTPTPTADACQRSVSPV